MVVHNLSGLIQLIKLKQINRGFVRSDNNLCAKLKIAIDPGHVIGCGHRFQCNRLSIAVNYTQNCNSFFVYDFTFNSINCNKIRHNFNSIVNRDNNTKLKITEKKKTFYSNVK